MHSFHTANLLSKAQLPDTSTVSFCMKLKDGTIQAANNAIFDIPIKKQNSSRSPGRVDGFKMQLVWSKYEF